MSGAASSALLVMRRPVGCCDEIMMEPGTVDAGTDRRGIVALVGGYQQKPHCINMVYMGTALSLRQASLVFAKGAADNLGTSAIYCIKLFDSVHANTSSPIHPPYSSAPTTDALMS